MIKEWCWFSQINFFVEYFRHRINIFVSFQPIWCHPRTQIGTVLLHCVRINIPNWKPSPSHASNRIFLNCLSRNSLAKGWPYRFRSRGTTGSSILDHDFGHLCRGRRVQMSGHADFGIFNNFGASSIFTWVLADTASAALSCAPWQSGYDIHDFSGCHLGCWWTCSVNTA